MGFVSVLSFAHQLISQRVQFGETVIDATLGNGVDTLFLAKLVGQQGAVYGFDIQQQALDQTTSRLSKELSDQTPELLLSLCSHEFMEEALPASVHGTVAAVTFNLGYLPGAESDTITKPEATIPALNAALRLLRKGGIVTIVLYRGHEGGGLEADAVEQWAAELTPGIFQSLRYQFTNSTNHPPYLLAIEKR
jgi:predicted methyltransferase